MKLTQASAGLFLSSALVLVGGFVPKNHQPKQQLHASTTALNKFKVFIDGEVGTTGLQVRGRIEARDDLEIISAPFELRKDEETRKKLINEADAVILCTYACIVEMENGYRRGTTVPFRP